MQRYFLAIESVTLAHLSTSLLAEILVVSLHELALHIEVQRLFQAALAPDIQANLPHDRSMFVKLQ